MNGVQQYYILSTDHGIRAYDLGFYVLREKRVNGVALVPFSSSWLMGRRPEYTDPKVVAQGEGREGGSLPYILCTVHTVPSTEDAHNQPSSNRSGVNIEA